MVLVTYFLYVGIPLELCFLSDFEVSKTTIVSSNMVLLCAYIWLVLLCFLDH